MAEAFVEIWSNTVVSDGQREIRGTDSLSKYKNLRDNATKFRAAVHNTNFDTGETPSTMFHVVADQSLIDDLVGSHTDHANWGISNAVYRGLEIKPGTPTNNAVNKLQTRILDQTGEDIGTVNDSVEDFSDHPDASGSSPYPGEDFLKNDTPSLQPGDDGYRRPFDPTSWIQ